MRLKEEQSWGFDIAWGDIDTKCDIFPHFSEWEQLYFAWLNSLPYKYNVFKCLQLPLGDNCYVASIYCLIFYISCFLLF